MTDLSEKLKSLLEEKGIKWETQYSGALARLVNIFDETIAELIMVKSTENVQKVIGGIASAEYSLTQSRERLNDSIIKSNRQAEELKKIIDAAEKVREGTVSDAQDVKTLNMFKALLSAGKDVFGDERMTDSAIESVCNSASYIVWRGIMGPKFEGKDEPRILNRR